MGFDRHNGLRGFDSYEVKLGDTLRGERASLGKSLLDVGRDLKIKAEFIDAIENADASAFPFAGFASGYVKSYARYLGLDPDEMYARFCAESGFGGGAIGAAVEQAAAKTRTSSVKSIAMSRGKTIDDAVVNNRFLARNTREMRFDIGAGLRSVASIGLLLALVGGIGYGGWSMVQNLQRVGFAPLPSAPDVRVSAPDFFTPGDIADARPVETNALDDEAVSLASIYAAQETLTPVVEPRDGPISSINPDRAGIYAAPSRSGAPLVADAGVVADTALTMNGVLAATASAVLPDEPAAPKEDLAETAAGLDLAGAPAGPVSPDLAVGVHVYATAEAWVRVRGEGRKVLFSGILQKGERFELPAGAANIASLRAGNAGAIYIVIDGHAFGPLGQGPSVAKNVSLAPESVRTSYPAAAYLFAASDTVAPERQASAEIPLPVAFRTE